jgi:hypothetical protein
MAAPHTTEVRALPPRRSVPGWRLQGPGLDVELSSLRRVGSAPGNDVVVSEASVSRVHAELVPEADGLRVRDLGSTNGTRVNGVRVEEALAEPGMTVHLGQVRLAVQAARTGTEPLSAAARFGPLLAGC